MLTTERCRTPLIVLFLLTTAAVGAIVAALVVSYLKSYLGLLVTSSSTFVCSNYLTFKLENNNVSVYNLSFFGGAFALLISVLVMVQLLYLLVKCCKSSEEYLGEFT